MGNLATIPTSLEILNHQLQPRGPIPQTQQLFQELLLIEKSILTGEAHQGWASQNMLRQANLPRLCSEHGGNAFQALC